MLYLFFHKAYGYQTWQGDGLWQGAVMYKVKWFFDQVIIWNHVANRKRHVSNSTVPMDTDLGRVVAHDMGLPLKKLHHP